MDSNLKALQEINALEKQLQEFQLLIKAQTMGQRLRQMSTQTESATPQESAQPQTRTFIPTQEQPARAPSAEKPAEYSSLMQPKAQRVLPEELANLIQNHYADDAELKDLHAFHQEANNRVKDNPGAIPDEVFDTVESKMHSRIRDLKGKHGEISKQAAEVVRKHSYDPQIQALRDMHQAHIKSLSSGSTDHTTNDTKRLENAIVERANHLESLTPEQANPFADIRRRIGGSPSNEIEITPKDKKKLKRYVSQGEMSPMQAAAKQAEKSQVKDYVRSYSGESPEQGVSFQLAGKPIMEAYGKSSERPSKSRHFVHYDGKPVGEVEVHHKGASGDEPYFKVKMHDRPDLENEVKTAIAEHLKSPEFRRQMNVYDKPSKEVEEIEKLRPEKARTSTIDQSDPEAVRREQKELRENVQQYQKEKDPTSANVTPKAPLKEFSREQALASQRTAAAPAAPQKQKKQISEETKKLRSEIPSVKAAKQAEQPGDPLDQLINHPDPAVRNQVIDSFLQHGNQSVIERLLSHSDDEVAQKAFKRLRELKKG